MTTTTNPREMTADEFFESLTGFDELAIAKHFGAKPIALSNTDPMWFARSLVFVAHRRGGMADAEAKKAALELTVGNVNEFFVEDEDETSPDEPVTEAGKDDSSPETLQTISPRFASSPE